MSSVTGRARKTRSFRACIAFCRMDASTSCSISRRRHSIADQPALATGNFKAGISLYFVVDDIDTVESKLHDVQKVIPRRETFYGATEVGVRDPAGYVMCFSQHK